MEQYNSDSAGGDSSPKSGMGALVGAVIIILLLAFGAFYFWGAKLNSGSTNPPPLILGNETASAVISSDSSIGLPAQGNSDEAAAISADVQAMNIDLLSAQNTGSLQSFGVSTQ